MPLKTRVSLSRSAAALRDNWRFRLILGGSSLSMLGSRLTSIAYPMLVLFLTRSPAIAGLAVTAATLPSIFFYLPAGALVDRWNPRITLLTSEFIRGLAILSVVIVVAADLVAAHPGYVWCIIVASVVEEIFEVFATLAEKRLVQLLVPPELSSAAQVRIEARTHIVVLIGRALGSMLFVADHMLPFLADAVSFFCSIGSALGIGKEAASPNDQKIHDDAPGLGVRAGLGWLRKHPAAGWAFVVTSAMTLASKALIIVFLSEAKLQNWSSMDIGIALAASGLGGMTGAVAGQRLRVLIRFSPVKSQPLIWALMLSTLAIAHAWVPCMAATMLVLGLIGAMGNVELDTYLIRRVRNGMLARVTSVGMLVSFSACALGPVIGGFLAETIHVVPAIWVLAGLAGTGALFTWRMPSLVDLPERDSEPGTQPEELLRPEDGGGDAGLGEGGGHHVGGLAGGREGLDDLGDGVVGVRSGTVA